MIDEIINARDGMVKYLRKELVGPAFGDNEKIMDPPSMRYTMGILFPKESQSDNIVREEDPDSTGNTGSETERSQFQDQSDDPVSMANQFLPGSMGISFFLRNDPRIYVKVEAARYEKVEQEEKTVRGSDGPRKKTWQRIPLKLGGDDNRYQIVPEAGSFTAEPTIFNEGMKIYTIWRPVRGGWLVTVTVINLNAKEGSGFDPEDCFYQVRLECRPVGDGEIPEYPHNRILSNDREEQIMDILYRKKMTFGVGHGCSVDWVETEKGTASKIWTELLPSETVPPIDFKLDEKYGDFERITGLYYLAKGESYQYQVIAELDRFVNAYEAWIADCPSVNADIPERLFTARNYLLESMNRTATRMRVGVRVLNNDPVVFRAFCLANQAMLRQYIHARDEYAGKRKKIGESVYQDPSLEDYQERQWRPFQLAFQLLTISSISYPDSPERNIVDLIWFPTGGGKTEAYLAMTAFIIFYRRMVHGVLGSGTTAIMRYTLRLLTTQQFQRAATMICACEMIRRENPDELGIDPISIGLWIGGESTLTFQSAFNEYEKLLQSEQPVNPFMLEICPWCGTELIPATRKEDLNCYGFSSSPESFYVFCPQEKCPFNDRLPIGMVDQQLYQNPPSLLLATVDKFARMVWVGESRAFFGAGIRRPPELIIQDELHLISGPLGTIAGVYETAIDMLTSLMGTHPKILASTATIRRANDQSLGLFAREVNLFPPSGLDIADSFFARHDLESAGRLYVGVMGQGHTASTSMIRTSAALLQGPIELGLQGDALDAYWTLIAYHNSLRELGKSLTFAKDDIPARIMVIEPDQDKRRKLDEDNIDELTSNKKARELIGMLERLGLRYDQDRAFSFIVCTNMFSVGVDVQRLGLMLVNGQPKSTSEYIQSTSRVGRGVPGLVICLLSPTKPRDRSHYERFKAYHSALYRAVEPTSVTPFSAPARRRALHAALVAMIRHGLGLNDNGAASQFRAEMNGLSDIIDFILNRVSLVDPDEVQDTETYLQQLIEEWDEKARDATKLEYRSSTRAKQTLLVSAGYNRADGWDTLNSMRNVDRSSILKIVTGKGI